MSEDLICVVYFSHAKRALDDASLLGLLSVSRDNNAREGVTGILLYHDGNFVQALEGPRRAVEEVFARIRSDPAHDGIIATSSIPIDARQFPDWSMGFVPSSDLDEDAARKLQAVLAGRHAAGAEFDTVATSLLQAFRAGLPPIR